MLGSELGQHCSPSMIALFLSGAPTVQQPLRAFQKLGEPNYRNVVIWAVQGLCETGQPLEKAMEALEPLGLCP